jgi:hypothetical protein
MKKASELSSSISSVAGRRGVEALQLDQDSE